MNEMPELNELYSVSKIRNNNNKIWSGVVWKAEYERYICNLSNKRRFKISGDGLFSKDQLQARLEWLAREITDDMSLSNKTTILRYLTKAFKEVFK